MQHTLFKQIVFTITLLSLLSTSHTHTMLNNIAGTDIILHNDYKYLSLVHGAIAWETGVIRRLYDFGQIFPVYGTDKQGRKVIENYENPEQSSKLVRLIHAFFYRVPGSTAETDFGATVQLAQDDPSFVVPLVAEIIVQCKQLEQQREQFQQAVEYAHDLIAVINDGGWLPKLGRKVTQKNLDQKIIDVQEKPWNENASTAFISMCKSFTKNLEKELGQCAIEKLEEYQHAAEAFFNTIKAATNNLKKLFKPEVFKKREQVESFIVDALNESDPNNPEALYPEHTVEMALLAFIYKKYSANRTLLKAFYDALNAQLKGKVLLHELTDTWVKDSFKPVTQTEAMATIKNIFNVQYIKQSIGEHLAEFIYNAFQIRTFTPVGYASTVYEYTKDKKTPVIADCMDNAIRNFINAYAYDIEQNKFTLTQLLASTGLKTIHPTLIHFLQSFADMSMAPSQEAHNAWLQVISNIPYVAYNRMIDGITEQMTKTLDDSKGYILIPKQEQNIQLLNWLKTNHYQLLTANQYGYELQPSLKNIIIVFDHLLQLNLFTASGGLAKEFMRPDFIKEYFPKLCSVLQANCFMSTHADAQQGELDKDFDALDYTPIEIYSTIQKATITCKFTTYSGHGELHLVSSQKTESIAPLIRHHITDLISQPSLSLLATYLLLTHYVTFEHLTDNKTYIYLNLFAIPLENTGLLEQMVNEMYIRPLKVMIFIKDLFMRLAEKQPDETIREFMRLDIMVSCVRKFSPQNLAIRTDLLENALELAAKGMAHQNSRVRTRAIHLFHTLFERRQGVEKAEQIAETGTNDQSASIRMGALDLFAVLVDNKHSYNKAEQAAERSITDPDSGVRSSAAFVFERLITKTPDHTKQTIQRLLNDPSITLPKDIRERLNSLFTRY